MKRKTSWFDNALAIISIWGFLIIAVQSFFKFNISEWGISVLMLLAGSAFIVEGKISTFKRWSRDGFQRLEVPLVLSITFGLFIIIVGILKMPIIHASSEALNGIVGFVALFALIFIAVQKWWVK